MKTFLTILLVILAVIIAVPLLIVVSMCLNILGLKILLFFASYFSVDPTLFLFYSGLVGLGIGFNGVRDAIKGLKDAD